MLLKNGEYNSLWQSVGDLKSKESKTISLSVQQRRFSKESTQNHVDDLHFKKPEKITSLNMIDHIPERKSIITNTQNSLNENDNHYNSLIMTEIEDHQKRHTFAPSLHQAEQNYRELRRLLRKLNRSIKKI